MVKKLSILVAAGAGYVLGARAGRERYDQIMTQAQKVAGNPKVQDAAHKAQDAFTAQATTAAGVAKDKASEAADKVRGNHNNDAPIQVKP